jgi:Cys-rich protein (TIGR01571 family)
MNDDVQKPQQGQVATPVQGTVLPTYTQDSRQPNGPPPTYAIQPQWNSAPQFQVPVSNWSTELLDCGNDINSCVDVLFCHYCQSARQYNMISYGKQGVEPWTCLGALVIDGCVGFHLGSFFLAWHIRQRIRLRYHIPSTDMKDCVESFFCVPCVLCQHYREMSVRAEWPGGCIPSTPYVVPRPPVMGAPAPSVSY